MPYTEFRKSYGDFEIVIPPVDFSSLTKDEASHTVNAMRSYESSFVCLHLEKERALKAKHKINYMLTQHSASTIGGLVVWQLNPEYDNDGVSFFGSMSSPGIVLRKAWCDHMANEIEREFALTSKVT